MPNDDELPGQADGLGEGVTNVLNQHAMRLIRRPQTCLEVGGIFPWRDACPSTQCR